MDQKGEMWMDVIGIAFRGAFPVCNDLYDVA